MKKLQRQLLVKDCETFSLIQLQAFLNKNSNLQKVAIFVSSYNLYFAHSRSLFDLYASGYPFVKFVHVTDDAHASVAYAVQHFECLDDRVQTVAAERSEALVDE